jgi:hypothetical protein
MASNAKRNRVNMGVSGQTPKKELMYSQTDPSSSVSWLAFAQNRTEDAADSREESWGSGAPLGDAPSGGDLERPKTSRHKSRPTPDEFTDYVIPSPERGRLPKNATEQVIISFSNNGEQVSYL